MKTIVPVNVQTIVSVNIKTSYQSTYKQTIVPADIQVTRLILTRERRVLNAFPLLGRFLGESILYYSAISLEVPGSIVRDSFYPANGGLRPSLCAGSGYVSILNFLIVRMRTLVLVWCCHALRLSAQVPFFFCPAYKCQLR